VFECFPFRWNLEKVSYFSLKNSKNKSRLGAKYLGYTVKLGKKTDYKELNKTCPQGDD
jgi:hypothetical protein